MSSLKAVKDAIFPHISVMGSDPFCDPAFLRYKCAHAFYAQTLYVMCIIGL